MGKLLIPIITLLAVALVVTLSDRPTPRADFVFLNRGEVNTLDPQRMSWLQDLRVARLVYQGLLRNDIFHPDFVVAPAVATSVPTPEIFYEIYEPGSGTLLRAGPDETAGVGERASRRSRYTFNLREDAKWSNGQPVTANDFIYSWRRGMLPDSASEYANVFQFVRGARAFGDFRTGLLERYRQMPMAQSESPAVEYPTLESIFERNERSQAAAIALYAHTLDVFYNGIARERAEAIIRSTGVRRRLGLEDNSGAATPDTVWPLAWGVGIIALDDHTLEITLERPIAYFLDYCAFGVTYPVYEPLVSRYEIPKAVSGALELRADWTKPGRIVGNGPFIPVQWRFKRNMRLEQNPHYWDRASLAIRSIDIPSIEDPSAAVLAFETGQVDWVSDVTADYRGDMWEAKRRFYDENREQYERLLAQGLDPFEIDRRLPSDPRKNIHVTPVFGTYFYLFNCNPRLNDGTTNPFADPRARRAFAMVTDKRSVAEDIRRVGERITGSLVPSGSLGGYTPPRGIPCISEASPEQREQIIASARELLLESMRDNGIGTRIEDFPTVEILFNKEGGHDLIALAIGRSWERNLGVRIRPVQQELKTYRVARREQNFMVARGGWYGDYNDPTTFLDMHKTGDGNNDSNYINPEYDALLLRASEETDPVRRYEMLSRAEAIIVEQDLPVMPVFVYNNIYLFNADRLSGITPHPRSSQNLYLVDILDDDFGPNIPLQVRRRDEQ